MVGLSDLFWAYQNSGPAMLFLLAVGGAYAWKHDIQPRLKDLERTQEDRGDRVDDMELNARERTLLINDAHDRTDGLEDAVTRLRERLRGIEQRIAAEHGKTPPGFTEQNGLDGFRNDRGGESAQDPTPED